MRDALPYLACAFVLLAYARQYVRLRDTRRLLRESHEHLTDPHAAPDQSPSGLLDPLTGLPNRTGFGDIVAEQLQGGRGQARTMVVLRPIRTQLLDNLDSEDSDAAISELAVRIDGCLGPDDHLARTSEATFAVLVSGDQEVATSFVRDVMLAVEAPVRTPFRRLHLSLAAGISATCGLDGQHPPATVLLQQATIALNTVASLPAGLARFTPQMLREDATRRDLAQAVVRTLRNDSTGNIDVLFEPVVELSSGRLVGVAARAHWRDADYGALSAGQLVALARQAGLAERVDDTVLSTAISNFSSWRDRWPDTCQQLWITVCAETLTAPQFPGRLWQLLHEADLPTGVLVLDPLDAIDALDNRASGRARETLRNLRAAGVRIATSDAMALGDRSPAAGPDDNADYFDISPVLVDRCVDDLRARHLVQATVEFAGPRGAATAARQVTEVDQHEKLRQLGCALARGPLYGQPLPPPEAEELVAAAAAGAWQTPVGQEAKRRRSSLAWEELRQVIHDLPITAFACNAEGVLVLAEGSLLDHLGGAEDTLDHSLPELFDPEPATGGDGRSQHPLALALERVREGVSTVNTVPVRGRWLQVHLCPRRGADETVAGALGIAIDVTHRIQAEHALRASDKRFREVFAQAPVGMLICTMGGSIIQANPALAKMLDYTPEDLVSVPLRELWHRDNPPTAIDQFTSLGIGEIFHYVAERAYRHRDGSAVWTHVSVAALADSDGQRTVLAIIEDLRQVRQLEIELRHAQKLEAVGMLAAGIAHEINTPIQFIGDNINFLADAFGQLTRVLTAAHPPAPTACDATAGELEQITAEVDLPWLLEEVPNAARQSLEGVARVAAIVRAMRNFGHPDQRDPSPIDINAAIRDTVTIARNEHKYVADLHLDLEDIPPVLGYPSEFHQVVLNLIVNAAHAVTDAIDGPGGATRADGTQRGNIRVRSWADESTAHVSVSDDGCGMTPEVRAHIFDPFFTTKEVGRGTGQGLTIVHSVVVEKHHGTIDVESTPDEGTVITVHLPMAPFRQGAR